MALYFDASAYVKLAVVEAESEGLRRFVATRSSFFSSVLLRVEFARAVRRHDPNATDQAMRLLDQVVLIALDDDIIERAALIEPPTVRSLDAIHLAAALMLGEDLEAVVTYDRQMAGAARALGLRVEAPGAPPSDP